jgi:2-polyprenyl-6-methoxyphenol hydroxylase-like FAD-dependent oxidoreductase
LSAREIDVLVIGAGAAGMAAALAAAIEGLSVLVCEKSAQVEERRAARIFCFHGYRWPKSWQVMSRRRLHSFRATNRVYLFANYPSKSFLLEPRSSLLLSVLRHP